MGVEETVSEELAMREGGRSGEEATGAGRWCCDQELLLLGYHTLG